MRNFSTSIAAVAVVASLAACSQPPREETTIVAPAATTAAVDAVAVGPAALPTGFTVEAVPESTATLPPFPMFTKPEGLTSIFSDKDKNLGFARENFIAGDKIMSVEGKLFHDGFNLEGESRRYSELEFQRNYENAITALGGRKISMVQFTDAVIAAAGGRDKIDEAYHGACSAEGCHNDSYLIRNGGKEYWINVSTGRIPAHGYVTVLERQAMAQSVGFLTADAMKTALDQAGRVALYINFDTDKATIRSDGTPAVTEIVKLLKANPALKLSVEGHTDNVGTAARNRTLSTERAGAVRAALIAQGIAADRLTAKGFGPDKPVADNGGEDGRAKNRRVELVKVG